MSSTNGQGLTIQEILKNAQGPVIERVETPAWGGSVYVRELTADGLDRYEMAVAGMRETGGMRRALVGACLCDAAGKAQNPSDAELEALGRIGGSELGRVATVCLRINGLTEQEDLGKNSEKAGVSDSG